jgi:hypothetical protein
MFAAGVRFIKNIITLAKMKFRSMYLWFKSALAILNLPKWLEQTHTDPIEPVFRSQCDTEFALGHPFAFSSLGFKPSLLEPSNNPDFMFFHLLGVLGVTFLEISIPYGLLFTKLPGLGFSVGSL